MDTRVKRIIKNSLKRNPFGFILGMYGIGQSMFFRLFNLHKYIRLPTTPWEPTATEIVSLTEGAYHTIKIGSDKYNDVFDKILLINGTKVGIKHYTDRTVIATRGSTTDENWIDNFNISQTYNEYLQAKMSKGYDSILNETLPEILNNLPKDKPIFITGGSLGGTMAIIYGWALDNLGYDISVYSFAGAMFTTASYEHLTTSGKVMQFHKINDPIPYIPPTIPFIRFKHSGDRHIIFGNGDDICVVPDTFRNRTVFSSIIQFGRVDWKEHLTYPQALKKYYTNKGYSIPFIK